MIDSHQHFWAVGRFDYPWMSPSMPVLYREYGPTDLAPLIERVGVRQTVAVQASPSVAETLWLLELAAAHPFIAGVVGWLDFEASDFSDQLDRLRVNPLLVGIRPAIEFIPDDNWLLRPTVRASLRAMAERGVPLDFIVWPRHLPAVYETVAALPGLRCVIDHLAKPDVKSGALEPWLGWMRRIAAFPGVHCKLSGLMTLADHSAWKPEQLRPYFDRVIDAFGPERLMYGSDWPVSLLASDYQTTIDVVREAVFARLGDSGIQGIFTDNARRFYGLRKPALVA